MSIGKLINLFSTRDPLAASTSRPCIFEQSSSGSTYPMDQSIWFILLAFTTALRVMPRSFLRTSGMSPKWHEMTVYVLVRKVDAWSHVCENGHTNQEVGFVEKGEGDVLSRLDSDSAIVGDTVTGNWPTPTRVLCVKLSDSTALPQISRMVSDSPCGRHVFRWTRCYDLSLIDVDFHDPWKCNFPLLPLFSRRCTNFFLLQTFPKVQGPVPRWSDT
jgi:hypothetical protein